MIPSHNAYSVVFLEMRETNLLWPSCSVVLVDELDQMVTKKQDVIYNFFNWPHMAHSKLIVIAIANTMDLPERELSGKIRSRLGESSFLSPPTLSIAHGHAAESGNHANLCQAPTESISRPI